MARNIISGMLIMASFVFIGCEQPNEETSTGSVLGKVILKDQFGVQLGVNSGVTIQIDELEGMSTVSDSSGNWMMKDVPLGIYTFRFSKAEFGEVWLDNFQFIGEGEYSLPTKYLFEFPTFRILELSVEEAEYAYGWGHNYFCRVSSVEERERNVVLFWGENRDVSNLNDSHLLTSKIFIHEGDSTAGTGAFWAWGQSLIDFYNLEVLDTIFIRAYPVAKNSSFYSEKANKYQFTAIGEPYPLIVYERLPL